MRRHAVRTGVTLGAVVLLSAGLGTASAAPAAPASRATAAHTGGQQQQPVFVDCLWNPRVRPEAFILACGDGNSRLSSLHWAKWNGMSATATGVNLVNDCKPYCAAGTFHSYPVIVRLDDPQPWKKNPQLEHYTRLSLVFTGERPEGYQSMMTYSLWN